MSAEQTPTTAISREPAGAADQWLGIAGVGGVLWMFGAPRTDPHPGNGPDSDIQAAFNGEVRITGS